MYKRPAGAAKAAAPDPAKVAHMLGTDETAVAESLHPVPNTNPPNLDAAQGAAVGQLLATSGAPAAPKLRRALA